MIINNFTRNSLMTSWIGQYTFCEFALPNQNMKYEINVYEDDGLYAYIAIDGFHTLKRLKTKVWSRENEIMFVFYQYYTDLDGNNTLNESYNEG